MKKQFALLLMLFLFLGLSSTTFAAEPVNRIEGKDRFEVGVKVSNRGWPDGADTVVLVNYNAYADALAATPLAFHLDSPILLTHSNTLTETTKNEIIRLKAKEVLVIGGRGSINDDVVRQLKNLTIGKIRRIDGANRFEVSSKIAGELPPSSHIIIAYGMNFPDALSIAPYAASNGYPILLTETNDLPKQSKEAMIKRKPTASIIVGGEGSISKAVEKQLPKPLRIGGKDRYEVSANIVSTLKLPTANAFVATGATFADALTGSVVAAKENAPILLTAKDTVPSSISNLITAKDIQNFVILGGKGSVGKLIPNQLLHKFKIVVDAGHGGKDPGAVGHGLEEKEVVLDVAQRLQTLLQEEGILVIMTRESDTYPTLSDRVEVANSIKADAFISIHANSSVSSSANGSETYWDSSYFGKESKELAENIQTQLVEKMDTRDRGVKEAGFYVIKNTTMPSVLVELAFISNSADAKKLSSSTYRDKAAEAMFQGIMDYYR